MYTRICCHMFKEEVYVFGSLNKDNPPFRAGEMEPLRVYPVAETNEAIQFAANLASEHGCKLGCKSGGLIPEEVN